MVPGIRVTLNATFDATAPFGTVSLTPPGIDTLPPLGPITAVAVEVRVRARDARARRVRRGELNVFSGVTG